MTKLWEESGKTLISQVAGIGAPALVFWAWVTTVWLVSHGGWAKALSVLEPLMTAASGASLLLVVTVGVILLTLSVALVNRAHTPVLRLLEGYWPRMAHGVANRRAQHWATKIKELEEEAAASDNSSTSTRTVMAAERRLRTLPAAEDVLPTRVGNIIRAGERRPLYWYGLDPIILWPQLWLLLPEQPRTAIATARNRLDHSVTAFVWAALSIPLGFWWCPAAVVGLVTAGLIWWFWIPGAAMNFATVLTAIFDTHRFALYRAFHMPLPESPSAEAESGQQITAYLANGTHLPERFDHPDE